MLSRITVSLAFAVSSLVVAPAFAQDDQGDNVEEFRRRQVTSFFSYANQLFSAKKTFERVSKELSGPSGEDPKASNGLPVKIPGVNHRSVVFESASKFTRKAKPFRSYMSIEPMDDYRDLIPHYSEFYVPHHTEFAPVCPTPRHSGFSHQPYCPPIPPPLHSTVTPLGR